MIKFYLYLSPLEKINGNCFEDFKVKLETLKLPEIKKIGKILQNIVIDKDFLNKTDHLVIEGSYPQVTAQ